MKLTQTRIFLLYALLLLCAGFTYTYYYISLGSSQKLDERSKNVKRNEAKRLPLQSWSTPGHAPLGLPVNDSFHTILIWTVPYGNDYTLTAEYLFNLPLPDNPKHFILDSPHCGKCLITFDRTFHNESSAVLFFAHKDSVPKKRGWKEQYYIWWWQESTAYSLFLLRNKDGRYDWSMTVNYLSDVYSPYASFSWLLRIVRVKDTEYDFMRNLCKFKRISTTHTIRRQLPRLEPGVNATSQSVVNDEDIELDKLISSKNRMAIWFESHCIEERDQLAGAMENAGFKVDKFGRCFDKYSPNVGRWTQQHFEKISKYKFYLAFENVIHCRGYMTEKLWYNALYSGAVPIIFGPHRDDVRKALPPKTYIHVEDFTSPEALVQYLLYLDKNDTAYREYLEWRRWTKFLDADGLYYEKNLERLPDKEKPSDEVKDYLNRYARTEPIGFCGLCQKLHAHQDDNEIRDALAPSDIERGDCWVRQLPLTE